ncbi:MAG: UDP-N-acetylglucosamine 2-epimerase (non-hydrolyzing) [Candidatus Marinimicrobia bacterium]|nr:UDP-N-acetylglucosamine 2-epimerase (non-hydrolyzing) [Candidatus Neomarinimicrobiota bacterium]
MRTIHFIGGARPNFIKIAPLLTLFDKESSFNNIFINTGQHYDKTLSDNIMKALDLRKPNLDLKVGSGSSVNQISLIMKKYEEILKKTKPDLVIVFGDVNSTLAGALAAKKNGVKVAHVEAGLRCYDDNLPEEINRRLTDSISDILFTPSKNENLNLKKENITKNVFFVGNIMIDSLISFFEKTIDKPNFSNIDGLMTLHRPENVDEKKKFESILKNLEKWTKRYRILFPIHPRTKKNLIKFKLLEKLKKINNLNLVNPLSYSEFLLQLKDSKFIITDSGGIQEEASFLGKPCFTLRKNTERPVTIKMGSNKLVKLSSINKLLNKELKPKKKKSLNGTVKLQNVFLKF